eukprot:TRINITY_DN66575_c0_g1_i1.p2 TRINITY_DN66575_c0_g1~~TRINITY_DN66575_c0_g1_i1.p2  ORF type:complete len:265 (+),score=92.47 TRINITY_DN66575_c0_g1_i1:69-863(+)
MPPKKKGKDKKKKGGGGAKQHAAGAAAAASPERGSEPGWGSPERAGADPGNILQSYDEYAEALGNAWPAMGMPPLQNDFVRLESESGRTYPVKGQPNRYAEFTQCRTEEDLHQVAAMMKTHLSEPYPIYTYRYFINNWPDLCWLCIVRDKDDPGFEEIIGAVTCKACRKSKTNFTVRGYIAMLAVFQEYRGNGYGSRLVELAVETMQLKGCVEVVLEAQLTNKAAIALYEGLGFTREKRLDKYYLDGSDAFRLKLWLQPPPFLP